MIQTTPAMNTSGIRAIIAAALHQKHVKIISKKFPHPGNHSMIIIISP